ncbi:MAG: protein kinase [Anaerolineae bacterium]|nr:protein kinase [Anaerolineae bacterium]
MTDLTNKQIGGFTVVERVGRGGMATVYRAHQTTMNRDVALKIIESDDLVERGDEFRGRFAQEAAVIASLEHIHVLPVYDYGFQDNLVYLAMRLLRGGTLAELMRSGDLSMNRAIELFSQVARGLAYAHSKGVIHRDLKPSNIMLDDSGNAVLTDFGLAKWVHGTENITRTGNIVGTPAYMSPEQLKGETVDHRSDIYSMGIILYQMLTGKPPFDSPSSNVVSIIYQHLEKMPPAPSVHNADISPEIENVIMKALAKNPDDRFQTMGEMDIALRKAANMSISSSGNYPVMSVPKPVSETPTRLHPNLADKAKTNNPFLLIGGILSGLFMIVVIGFAVISSQNNANSTPATPTSDVSPKIDVSNIQATILTGEFGTPEDVVPTDEEIAIAQARVGDNFVAVIACNRTSEFHSGSVREITDFLNGYGIASRVYDADNNEARQPSLIEQARTDGAMAFVICPLNMNIMHDTLQALDNAHIPLTLFSTGGDGYAYGGIVTTGDDYDLGYKPGQFAGQIIVDELGGEAQVIILDYPDLPAIVARANGLEEGVLNIAPNATIIGRYLGGTEDFGKASVEQLLADGVEFNVIVSINDAGSLGAIEALEAANIPRDQVVIVSIDANAAAREAIRQGQYMRASVDIDRTASSKIKVDALIRILGGGTVPEQVNVPPGDMVTIETLNSDN